MQREKAKIQTELEQEKAAIVSQLQEEITQLKQQAIGLEKETEKATNLQQQIEQLQGEKAKIQTELEQEKAAIVSQLQEEITQLQQQIIGLEKEKEQPTTLLSEESEAVAFSSQEVSQIEPVELEKEQPEIVLEQGVIELIQEPESKLQPEKKSSLEGKNFVILGTLTKINRDKAKEFIQEAGGTVTNSPSTKTDYLLVGKAPGEKLKKAQKLGIAQLSEVQFIKLLETSGIFI